MVYGANRRRKEVEEDEGIEGNILNMADHNWTSFKLVSFQNPIFANQTQLLH